jgi:hypothetical protein
MDRDLPRTLKTLAFIFLFTAAQASAATLNQLRIRVDAWIDARIPVVSAKQEAFKSRTGRYWQGLATSATPPAHVDARDEDKLPDALDSTPTDQQESWRAAFPALDAVQFPCQLTCDVYSGPLGDGYVITIRVLHNGNTYSRAINFGPETSREYAWKQE